MNSIPLVLAAMLVLVAIYVGLATWALKRAKASGDERATTRVIISMVLALVLAVLLNIFLVVLR